MQQYKKTLELSKSTAGVAQQASSKIYLGHLSLVPTSEAPRQMKACQGIEERRNALEQQIKRFFRMYVANPPTKIVCDFDPSSAEPHRPTHIIVEFRCPEQASEAL